MALPRVKCLFSYPLQALNGFIGFQRGSEDREHQTKCGNQNTATHKLIFVPFLYRIEYFYAVLLIFIQQPHRSLTALSMMMKLSTLFATTTALLSCITNAEEYVYGTDPKRDAEYDISTGMAGIQQAAKDPKLLAQLFQDMQVGCY